MANLSFGFREVVSNQTISPKWRDITINTGAAQGTLQDIKRTESCGGYSYIDNSSGLSGNARNRFLYWRINHDVLEIAEESLDVELSGNHVCLRFQDTPILDGVAVFEHGHRVVLLVPTVSSVHRIVLPHPQWLNKQFFVGSLSSRSALPSILSELTVTHLRDPFNFHVLNLSGASGMLPHTSSCWLSEDGEAHFALANSSGSILHVCLPRMEVRGPVTVNELRKSTIMQRVFTGIVPSMMRSGNQSNDAPLSLVFHTIDQTLMLFALCRDCKIRLWSVKDQDCVMEHDLTRYVKDCLSGSRLPQTGQRHGLKKASGYHDVDLLLVAFLYFIDHRHFIVLQLAQDEGRYDLAHLITLYGPEHDLIDFSLTSTQLWVLWSTVESEPLLCYTTVYREIDPVSGWNIAALEPPIGRDFNLIEGFVTPMEAYCEQIFYPGRFSVNTINRAINIFRRPTETSYIGDIGGFTSAATLREEVIAAVETEIQNRASEYELSDDVYVQLQQECWSKFYLGCVQYHLVGAKPMGLFMDDNTGLVCIIKKSLVSVLRPCDCVEFLSTLPDIENVPTEVSLLPSVDEAISVHDMRALFLCLNIIHSKYNYELVQCFKYDLLHLTSPEVIAKSIVDNILTYGNDDSEVIRDLHDELNNLKALPTAVRTLLNVLDVSNLSPSRYDIEDVSVDAHRSLVNTHFLRSRFGSSVVAESVGQICQTRFDVCRDLLVFLVFLNEARVEMGISSEVSETLHVVIPQLSIFMQAYYVVTWICDTVASHVSPDVVPFISFRDVGARQLAFLSLSDLTSSDSGSFDSNPVRLIEMFVQGEGGSSARQLLSLEDVTERVSSQMWMNAFLPHVFAVLGLVWPINDNFLFPEYLLAKCQYMQLQEYVRLLYQWCEWNSCSCMFLCGYTHLVHGEGDKAMDWFLLAAEGVLQEEFIVSKLLQCTDAAADASHLVLFHMKVIRLFEQFLDAERVILMAKKTMDLPMHDGSNLLILHTLLFKYLLELGNSTEAYAAMISNPDYSRKKDCLRQFVVVLYERRELRELIEYPYEDLHDEVVDIMESRARTIDLKNHDYYELLYSFHVNRDNLRRAGRVMYEYGMRLGNEVGGLSGLQRQAKCYLAAMNSLRLVELEYAWIVKPLQAEQKRDDMEGDVVANGMSPKRTYEGEEIVPVFKRQVALVELKDIRLEYELVLARLQLVKLDLDLSAATGPSFTAEETVILLSKSGLFDRAIRICNAFNLPMQSVLEALANKCVHLMRVVALDPAAASEAWKWLGENEIPGISHLSQEKNASDYAWMLLKTYLEKHEEKGQVRLHHCVAVRLMNFGVRMPHWFLAAYKMRDVSDLLRLYLRFGLLGDATHLTLEYIDAVLGNGKEYFGLKSGLEVGSPAVWMPYTAIDNLLEALGANPKDHVLAVLNDTLKEKFVMYHCEVERVSKEMLKMKHHNLSHTNVVMDS